MIGPTTSRDADATSPDHIVIFSCQICGDLFEIFRYTCARCGGPLVIGRAPLTQVAAHCEAGIWRWRELFPPVSEEVTLGEADTPLLEMPSGQQLYLKMESLNPTLSFKDRAMALGASWALSHGYEGFVVASTGNAAVSASAYARAANLSCQVIVARDSEAGRKIEMCEGFGAHISIVDGDYSSAYRHAKKLESPAIVNVSTTYRNPIISEAYRGLAFEIALELEAVPAAVCVPVGAGPLLRGIEQGFQDYVAVHGGTLPAMIGVQADAVAPLANAWRADDWLTMLQTPHTWGRTIAGAIADPLRGYETEGLLTLDSARRSKGWICAVSDADIQRAHTDLLSQGVWIEPAAAAAYAVATRLRMSGPVVAIMTGHGAKI